jgi:hypothetical protein
MVRLKVLLICTAMLLVALPVMAGGWAVITFDSLPGEVQAGENVHLAFTVRQHGDKPVHTVEFMNNAPVEPFLVAHNGQTGKTIRATARRAEEVGRFTVDLVFPSEGTWQWEITPYPLEGTTQLEPLTVTAAVTAGTEAVASPAVASAPGVALGTAEPGARAREVLQWTALALLVASAGAAFIGLRQRREPVPAGSSRPD